MCRCKNINLQEYKRQTSIKSPFIERLDGWVCIDTCLVQEIAELWHLGINTIECCCGHNKTLGYIAVMDEYIEKMNELGYEQIVMDDGRGNFFYPKT